MLVGDIIPRNAGLHRDQPAIVFEGGCHTFGQYAERCYKLANALIGLGVQRQDRVSILARNSVEYLELFGAAEVAGLIVHPINFRLTAPEVAYLLGDADPAVVFFDAEFVDVVAQAHESAAVVSRFVQIGDAENLPSWAVSYDALIASGDPVRPVMRPEDDDTVFLYYSSGSTGRPKGIKLGQRAQWYTGLTVGYELGVTPVDRNLVVMPMFHIGARFAQLAHHMAGALIHMPHRFDAAAVADTIERDRITTIHLAPTMIRSILDLPDIGERDLSSLRTLSYGASAMPVALLRRALDRFGPIMVQRYGSTESAAVTYLDKQDHRPDGTEKEASRLASAGKPGPMAEVKVVREDGTPCDAGESGLVWVRNPNLIMQGYWKNPEATRDVLRDGWYRMGDLGYLDEDGFLFIVDRATELIISGGENIYPREVEEAILHHPAVADTAVIGVPDEKWGESVLAFVVLREGAQADEAEIIEFCQQRIASYKKPRYIEFRESLPRASTGKIDKIMLREPYWKGRDRKV